MPFPQPLFMHLLAHTNGMLGLFFLNQTVILTDCIDLEADVSCEGVLSADICTCD